jgi:hypothetical protein
MSHADGVLDRRSEALPGPRMISARRRPCWASRVGRSDSDVRGRLHEWMGMASQHERYASCAKAPWAVHRRRGFPVDVPMPGHVGDVDTSYTHFAYSYSDSAAEAFGKERRNFEDFGGRGVLDNQAEPVSAAG